MSMTATFYKRILYGPVACHLTTVCNYMNSKANKRRPITIGVLSDETA